MQDLLKELSWRGMIQDTMPSLNKQLQKEMTAAYIGFDPTASSLHIGNLAAIMLLKHLQLAGHKPIALVGGATGMIGDPSGKSQERKLLDEETLRANAAVIRKQLAYFLDFDCGENSAELVNNYDWFKDYSFLNFLTHVGKHLTVNYMMAKDSVKNRLETGISFTEFSYQLLQAYDFYHLHKHKNVKLQMGGSDQWGNITTGTELIRRMAGGSAYALTCPLVTKADGSKFGKSESGNVWLDSEKTSPYKFYQFWYNCADEDAQKLIRIFTLLSEQEITALRQQHREQPHLRILQKKIAQYVTTQIHGEEAMKKAVQASAILFNKSSNDRLQKLDERTLLEVFEGITQISILAGDYKNASDVTALLSTISKKIIFSSKGEAKRMIEAGGVSINKNKLTKPEQKVDIDLLQEKYLLVQKGKKHYYLLEIIA